MTSEQSPWIKRALVLVLFLISFAVLWVLGTAVFKAFEYPNSFWYFGLICLAGFWLAFLAIDWINDYFEIRVLSLWYPFVIAVLGFLAFYVSQFLYWCNAFTDIRGLNSSCGGEGVNRAIEYVNGGLTNFSNLTQDAFFYFMLAILLAWLSKVVLSFALNAPDDESKKKSKKKGKGGSPLDFFYKETED